MSWEDFASAYLKQAKRSGIRLTFPEMLALYDRYVQTKHPLFSSGRRVVRVQKIVIDKSHNAAA